MLSAASPDVVPCGKARFEVEGRVTARWTQAIADACRALADLPDEDATARISARVVGDELALDVHLADGRAATRRVHAPGALASTLEALLAVPAAPPAPRAVDPADPVVPGQPPPKPPSLFDVEVGGGPGARVAGPGPYVTGALAAFVQLHGARWVVGLGMRWEMLQHLRDSPAGFEAETLAVALTAARRLELGVGVLDVGVSPRLVAQTQSVQPNGVELTGTDTDVRMGVFARVGFGGGPVRLLVEADAEVSPTRLRRDVQVAPGGFPDLPVWSVGVTTGVLWGTP
ncbi:MAG TPA: hypothetical protein VHJ20_10045 [Polyangia bacterium]|nr:hypothetical protein [Polyangia bacterium]